MNVADASQLCREALTGGLEESTQRRLDVLTSPVAGIDGLALRRVVAVSRFVFEALERDSTLLARLAARDELRLAPPPARLAATLAEACAGCGDEEALGAALRSLRREWMVGIVWRDLCRDTSAVESAWDTARAVSELAEAMLEAALGWLEAHFAPRWGRPAPLADATPSRLVVLGMGKFGAGELNLSSDIDLIFAYPCEGETSGGRRSLSHLEYFTKLGQKLIRALDAPSAEGFVFRVDMRLRPLGDGGPLVGSFAALDRYYQDQGREWERFALLKARPVAGDKDAGRELLERLKPFVYRRYVDFGAIESLREMKAMINREVRRRGLADNIKLGAGGIREVEFVVQVFQLIRGGRDTELQTPSLARALGCLARLELLPARVVEELEADYLLLRDLEHVLQALEDRQTQDLPTNSLDRERVAFALGRAGWGELESELVAVRRRVHGHFEAVISVPQESAPSGDEQAIAEWRALWEASLDREEGEALLVSRGFADPSRVLARIDALRRSKAVKGMQRIGLERLDALMPLLLEAVAGEHPDGGEQPVERSPGLRRHYLDQPPDIALERVLGLIESVLRRTAYLSLLRESGAARVHLVRLCAASPWIAEQLTRHPVLLDELLTPAMLYSPADRERLRAELDQTLARIPEDDDEAQLEALRVFKHAQVLSVAASDLAGARTLMNVSDYLTFIAEVVLERVLAMAWRGLVARYGEPQGGESSREEGRAGFIIVGYGKLGGIELGYGSDLDLVFIHDAAPQGATSGPRAIDNGVFFTRLGQRIIHLLTAVTANGMLFDVDMRLRPSGNAGLLVTSLEAFAEYQHRHAWTWEHQALVRARAVAGSTLLKRRFESLRREVLGKPRDRERLREDVVKMRAKMREHLGSGGRDPERFDLKHDPGGLVDIEFLDQFAVLALGAEVPALLDYSDNVRILETLEISRQLPIEHAGALRNAYLAYRDIGHLNALAKRDSMVSVSEFSAHRQAVIECWRAWMEPKQP
ncbi:bifunctional glutamine synthetase adenylyltransferase/deadenyltransferase [Halotalea alkalilenta]|uniref:Bifunctional glutamine synthetase adenylyltransferase/adenylyl-removing enzyme n=1 Tax=Halotalea alkalilenta TaxID=376489 RepID=A0A172YKK0_9GAMM|nr:bifunctional glutamine synthetase adenylyltransferase/deadenyltransferase [Halotalea alkalilenta]